MKISAARRRNHVPDKVSVAWSRRNDYNVSISFRCMSSGGEKMKESEAVKHEGLFEGGDTTVTLTLDDGSLLECVVLTIFEAGDDGREYIALMPQTDDEGGEVYLYRYTETEDGQPDLTNIESDEEYEAVADAFDEILDAQEFNELFAQDDDDQE